jgi:hypothetical protein
LNKIKLTRKIVSILMILCIISGVITPFRVCADVVTDSESKVIVPDSNGKPALTITMERGIITITAVSHTATTSIRWETIGVSITKESVDEKGASAQGYTGPAPVTDLDYAVLWFKDAAEKTDYKDMPSSGYTTTIITFKAKDVETELKEKFENITENTYIYLHGIFDTYYYDADTGTKTIRKGGTSGIRNWETVMNAEAWGTDTLQDFYKYYNMSIQFKPSAQENLLTYVSEDGSIIFGTEALASVVPGKKVSWSTSKTEITYDEKTYALTGYYVTRTDSTKKLVSLYTDDVSKITSGSVEVQLGGMKVYLIYRETVPVTPTPTSTPTITEAPTPTPAVTKAPTPTPSITKAPTPTPEVVPKADVEDRTLTSAFTTGQILADDRGSEKFTVTNGIPTTESLFGQVTAKEYLLGYNFVKKVGTVTYSVPVTRNYILNWESATPDSEGGGTAKTVTVIHCIR